MDYLAGNVQLVIAIFALYFVFKPITNSYKLEH